MKNYLVKVWFFAGSDEQEDVDTGLFLFKSKENISFEEMKEIFKEANRQLDTFMHELGEVVFPISYENGLNLDTLIEGVSILTDCEIVQLKNDFGPLENIQNYYEIVQWQ